MKAERLESKPGPVCPECGSATTLRDAVLGFIYFTIVLTPIVVWQPISLPSPAPDAAPQDSGGSEGGLLKSGKRLPAGRGREP